MPYQSGWVDGSHLKGETTMIKKRLFSLVLLCTIMLSSSTYAAGTYTISLDRASYTRGEAVIITGTAPLNDLFALEVLWGNTVIARLPCVTEDGTAYEWAFSVPLDWPNGTYVVRAGKGTDYAETSFILFTLPTRLNITNKDAFLGKIVGDSPVTIAHQFFPADATAPTMQYASSNPSVATVNGSGRVSFLSAGTTTISARCGDTISDSFSLTVYANSTQVEVDSVTIGNKSAFTGKKVGDTGVTLSVSVLPANAANRTITFSSSAPGVASVNASGMVSFQSAGTTTISATSSNGRSDSFVLTVTKTESGGNGGGGGGGGAQPPEEASKSQTVGAEDWAKVIDAAKKITSGGVLTVEMGEKTVVPGTVLDAMAGKDITVVFKLSDGLGWQIDGKNVATQAAARDDMDLGATRGTDYIPVALTNVPGGLEEIQLHLPQSGAFDLNPVLTVTTGAGNAGKWANLFYYNSELNELEFCGAVIIASDGSAAQPVSHAGDYLVVVSETSLAPTTQAWQNPFTDVAKSDWFYGDVEHAVTKGIFSGTSATTFSPNLPMTRGMLVTVLGRMRGVSPDTSAEPSFADTPAGAYFTPYVIWAAQQGIVTGYSAERFGPDDNVTREQFAVILYRYAGSPALAAGQLVFTDGDSVSSWARDAIIWAVTEGIITGKPENRIDPQGNTTRAEAAAMLHRYLED